MIYVMMLTDDSNHADNFRPVKLEKLSKITA